MRTSDFNYHLPRELIAQSPVNPRDAARLLVINRREETLTHSVFSDLHTFLSPGDLLVLNETKVFPARIFAKKVPSGGKVELLLLRKVEPLTWEVIVGGKKIFTGKNLDLKDGYKAQIVSEPGGSRRVVRFNQEIERYLEIHGQVPLPPYIRSPITDPGQYQTVYAKSVGSAAAPTAGLHFTQKHLDRLLQHGIQLASVTLHIGLDTFAPVTVENPRRHRIHTEWCRVDLDTVDKVNQTRDQGRRVIAVGTTTVRTLETAGQSRSGGGIGEFEGPTDLYILPGYEFRVVDGMVTNFHLPRSSLLMMVSAFTGLDPLLKIYQLAIRKKYRFYSFGDAMLIL